jgi:tetratricopeptide (TPR) repeat protein
MAHIEKTVFISYRRSNFWTALAIYQSLYANGYDVFFDYRSIPSGAFAQVITENIKYRAHFIVVLSPSALERCCEPGDWLRREMELALEYQRNIIPLMMEGFDFGSPAIKAVLTGKLEVLKNYNAMGIPAEYFEEAMAKLRGDRFLNRPIDTVAHPVSAITEQITIEQQTSANTAAPVNQEQLTAQEWFERGVVFQDNKNLEESLHCYNQVLRMETDPKKTASTYYNQGVLYSDFKRYEEAEAAYRKAIKLNPSDDSAYSNLGMLLSDEHFKRFTEAEAAYRKAIEMNPEGDTPVYNLACLYAKQANIPPACEWLQRAISMSDEYVKRACTDTDFDPIRGSLAFQELLNKHGGC